MITRLCILIALLLSLGACNPLRPATSPQPVVPEAFSLQHKITTEGVPDRWWHTFSDPQLNLLEESLFSGNLDIRQALYRLEQSQAQYRQTHANRLPSLTLNGSSGRSQTLSSVGATRATSASVSLAAAYEIDLWNKLADRDEAARLQILASGESVKTLMLSLSAQLAEAYFLAQEQMTQLRLLETQKKRSANLLELVTRRYQRGLLSASSLYQAQRNLATIEAQIPTYMTSLRQAENTISLLLGQPPGSVRLHPEKLPPLQDPVPLGLPGDLLVKRPDVARALYQLQAVDHTLAATIAERLPALNLSATLGKAANSLSSGDVTGTIWSIVLGLSQPLFDGQRRQSAVAQQQALQGEQLAATQQVLLTAMEEIENSLISEQNYALRARQLENRKEANSGYLKTSLNNFRVGLSDSTNWLNSEIDQLGILSQQINNQRLWLSQRITLVRALGGSWMGEELSKQRASAGSR